MPVTDLPLRDIHYPPAIGGWPPAPGWWIVAILVPPLVWLLVRLYRRATRKTALKCARKLLTALKNDPSLDAQSKIAGLSVLLRRAAISIDRRTDVAALTGQAWLDYLDRRVPGNPFSAGLGRLLVEAPYRKKAVTEPELEPVFQLCENWLKAKPARKR